MTIAHIDCASGASGDMILGALVDAGLPLDVLRRELRGLGIDGWRLRARKVKRAGMRATKVDVITDGGAPGRRLEDIRRILDRATLTNPIREKTSLAMKKIFEAEAEAHGEPVGEIHLHELAAVDCLVDVAGAMIGLSWLGVERVSVSPVNLGGGTVGTEHGVLPVPAPATALLLRGIPVFSGGERMEKTTPTGAAILATVGNLFGPMPEMTLKSVGVGAGSADPPDRPNVLRVFIGERPGMVVDEKILVMEANIDDMDPRLFEHAVERLLAAGALDVFLTPILMKKTRPAVRMTVLSPPDRLAILREIMLAETTTFGVRAYEAGRRILERRIELVPTSHGMIRVKVGLLEGRIIRAMPEYEDCRRAARRRRVPLPDVMAEAERAAAVFLHPPETAKKKT